jgi:hypothetical protein
VTQRPDEGVIASTNEASQDVPLCETSRVGDECTEERVPASEEERGSSSGGPATGLLLRDCCVSEGEERDVTADDASDELVRACCSDVILRGGDPAMSPENGRTATTRRAKNSPLVGARAATDSAWAASVRDEVDTLTHTSLGHRSSSTGKRMASEPKRQRRASGSDISSTAKGVDPGMTLSAGGLVDVEAATVGIHCHERVPASMPLTAPEFEEAVTTTSRVTSCSVCVVGVTGEPSADTRGDETVRRGDDGADSRAEDDRRIVSRQS